MSRFDWQTDEDDWDDLPPPTESRPLALWKRLVIILVVFIFVGSSALVALRQIDFRSQKTVTEATADVQSAHDLWRQAVSAGDVQLVAGLLDQERYPLWAEAQLQRIGTGLPLFEREAYGFRLADSHWQENFAAADQINLASTLNHAEVTFTQTYQVLTPAALTETISLEHTLAYHYRDGQWLAGPLANTSWGATRTYRLPHLTLTFPERDSDIMQRLILDWGQLSQQLCAAAPPFLRWIRRHRRRTAGNQGQLCRGGRPRPGLRHRTVGDGPVACGRPVQTRIRLLPPLVQRLRHPPGSRNRHPH